jgi:hypothetical protein
MISIWFPYISISINSTKTPWFPNDFHQPDVCLPQTGSASGHGKELDHRIARLFGQLTSAAQHFLGVPGVSMI